MKFCIRVFGEGKGKLDPEVKQKANQHSELAKKLFSEHQRNRVNVRWQGYDNKKAQALEMLSQGVKQANICQELGIGKATLHRWKKSSKNKGV